MANHRFAKRHVMQGKNMKYLVCWGRFEGLGADTVTKERVWWIPGGNRRVDGPLYISCLGYEDCVREDSVKD